MWHFRDVDYCCHLLSECHCPPDIASLSMMLIASRHLVLRKRKMNFRVSSQFVSFFFLLYCLFLDYSTCPCCHPPSPPVPPLCHVSLPPPPSVPYSPFPPLPSFSHPHPAAPSLPPPAFPLPPPPSPQPPILPPSHEAACLLPSLSSLWSHFQVICFPLYLYFFIVVVAVDYWFHFLLLLVPGLLFLCRVPYLVLVLVFLFIPLPGLCRFCLLLIMLIFCLVLLLIPSLLWYPSLFLLLPYGLHLKYTEIRIRVFAELIS